jgi:hypothetical protein
MTVGGSTGYGVTGPAECARCLLYHERVDVAGSPFLCLFIDVANESWSVGKATCLQHTICLNFVLKRAKLVLESRNLYDVTVIVSTNRRYSVASRIMGTRLRISKHSLARKRGERSGQITGAVETNLSGTESRAEF